MDAGPVRLNLTYLTPIEVSHFFSQVTPLIHIRIFHKLDDWTRHSLPFGYFFIDLWSTDGKAHSVQLYSDISGGEYVSPLSVGLFADMCRICIPIPRRHPGMEHNGYLYIDLSQAHVPSESDRDSQRNR
jgi:hypothetical protein